MPKSNREGKGAAIELYRISINPPCVSWTAWMHTHMQVRIHQLCGEGVYTCVYKYVGAGGLVGAGADN